MKIDNFNYIFKGVLLTVCGVLLAFFPGVINWIFYIIGAIVIIGCVMTLLSSLAGGDAMLLPSSLAGAAIGVGIMFLPKFVSVQIPVFAGLIYHHRRGTHIPPIQGIKGGTHHNRACHAGLCGI